MKHDRINKIIVSKFIIITSLLPSFPAYPMFGCFGLKSKRIAEKNITISKENLSKIQESRRDSIHSSEISLEISSDENNTITKTPVIIKDSTEFKIYIEAINQLRETYFEQLEAYKKSDMEKINQIYENQNTILMAKNSEKYKDYKNIKDQKEKIQKNKNEIDEKIDIEILNIKKLKTDIENENIQISKAIDNIKNNLSIKNKTSLKSNLKEKITSVFLKEILETLANDIINNHINTESAQKAKLQEAIENLNFIKDNNIIKNNKREENINSLNKTKNELDKYHSEIDYYKSVKTKINLNKLIKKTNLYEIKSLYESIQEFETKLQKEYLNIINVNPEKQNYKESNEYKDNIKSIEIEFTRKKHNLLFDKKYSDSLKNSKENLDAKVFSYATFENKKEPGKQIQFYSISGELEFDKNYNQINKLYFVNLKNQNNRKLSYFEPQEPEKLKKIEKTIESLDTDIAKLNNDINNPNLPNRENRIEDLIVKLKSKETEYNKLKLKHQKSIEHEIEIAYINTKGEKEIGKSPRASDAEAKILEELLNLTIPNPNDRTGWFNERFNQTRDEPNRRSTTQRAKHFFDLDNFKSLNYYNLNQDIEGTLNIYTSLDTCTSCKNAYSLFKILRPKIDLNIYTLNKDLQTFIYKNDFNTNN